MTAHASLPRSIEAMPPGKVSEALLQEVCAYVAADPSFGGYVQKKFAALANPKDGRRYRTRLRYELQLAGAQLEGATVVDAGCGSGIYALLMLAFGAGTVVAIDYFPHNIKALERLVERFDLPLQPIRGDVAHTPCADASVDLVYCVEAISHFHDADAFLLESARVLRPGGRIVIADGNNGANPRLRRRIYEDWVQSEMGPFSVENARPGDNLPFLYRRWMLIRAGFPQLQLEDVFQLGLRTAGVGGEDLREVCHNFVGTNEMPRGGYLFGMSQRRPEDGQRNEEPIDPLRVVRRLRDLGCDAKARPHFGVNRGAAVRWLNAVATMVGSLSLRLAPTYVVHGVKKNGARS